MMQEYIQQFIALSQLAAHRPDWIQGPGGNTSVKLPDGTMLVKASGCLLKDVSAGNGWVQVRTAEITAALNHEDVMATDAGSMELVNGAVAASVAGTAQPGLRPSMETAFHCIFDTCVLHTHNMYANVLLCSDRYEAITGCFTEEDPYAVALLKDYYTPGAELSWWLWQSFRFDDGAPNVVFMPNHGIIISADSVDGVAAIHADVQQRMGRYLAINESDYPAFTIAPSRNGFVVSSDYLAACLRDAGRQRELFHDFLFPDQLIYLNGLEFSATDAAAPVFFDAAAGLLYLSKNEKEAVTIAELMVSTCWLYDEIRKRNWEPLTINFDAGKLRNMSSEQYRQQQLRGG